MPCVNLFNHNLFREFNLSTSKMKNVGMNRATIILLLVILPIFGAGCSWVTLSPSGAKARVLSTQEVTGCQKTGTTTVYTKAAFGPIDRADSVVSDELSRLARNAAEGLGGDTIVPITGVEKGNQTFDIYNCVP